MSLTVLGSRFPTLLLIFLLLITSGQSTYAQTPASAPRTATAARVEHAPRLDGSLDDPLWSSAPVIYDSAPSTIVATQLRRDLSQDLDDNFAVAIDSTLSHRNAYVFQVNPLGTQR